MSLQIYILGTLCRGEHHPYDIKKMFPKSMQKLLPINDGTLYYHFDVLLKKGFIEKIKVVQSDNRPEKTTYGVTQKGRKTLEDEIYAAFQDITDMKSLYSSILFLDMVDQTKLAYIIEIRIDKMKKGIEVIEKVDIHSLPSEQQLSAELITDHAYHSLLNDIRWLSDLLGKLR